MKTKSSFGLLHQFLKVFLIVPVFCALSSQGMSAKPGQNLPSPQIFENTIIGVLQTQSKSITIFLTPQGPVYSISSRTGESLGYKLSHQELLIAYPELEQTISKGLAGNDASLFMK